MFKSEHTLYLSFLLVGQATENKVKIGNWRSIDDARKFIFFTQSLARVQFKPKLPFLSVCIFVQKSFTLVFESEHTLYLSLFYLFWLYVAWMILLNIINSFFLNNLKLFLKMQMVKCKFLCYIAIPFHYSVIFD